MCGLGRERAAISAGRRCSCREARTPPRKPPPPICACAMDGRYPTAENGLLRPPMPRKSIVPAQLKSRDSVQRVAWISKPESLWRAKPESFHSLSGRISSIPHPWIVREQDDRMCPVFGFVVQQKNQGSVPKILRMGDLTRRARRTRSPWKNQGQSPKSLSASRSSRPSGWAISPEGREEQEAHGARKNQGSVPKEKSGVSPQNPPVP